MATHYNERSWAIDLISEINRICGQRTRPIMRAGGENTVTTDEGSLFPDVLLYARDPADAILQGWELKMPDTPITDRTLYEKARTKAKALGLNSFLLWNVKTAQLYTSADLDEYKATKTWNLSGVDSREQVPAARKAWVQTLEQILDGLNDLFEKGIIEGRRFIESFSEHILVDSILENVPAVSKALRDEARINAAFDAEVRQWWLTVKSEYHGEKVPWEVLAKSNILSLINKFVFAHVLKVYHSSAGRVDEITGASRLQDALSIFGDISGRCDFWPVFQPTLGQTALTPKTWSQIVQLNVILSQLRFPQVDQNLLGRLLEGAVEATKRKVSGQYVTPAPVAELLVRLTLRNKEDAFYDPFCGTGTIARTAYEIKLAYEIASAQAIDQVWASDKYSFPLQIASIALAKPENMGRLIRVFQIDALGLRPNLPVEFRDPNTGARVSSRLPEFKAIAANLPFVQQEDVLAANPGILKINDFIRRMATDSQGLDGRSDSLAYWPFYLWKILVPNAMLGIIVSNAWLGTQWGKTFRGLLNRFYKIEYIITSGKGRWFQNADIVTNMLVLRRRERVELPAAAEVSSFCSVLIPLDVLAGERVQDVASSIMTGTASSEVHVKPYTQQELKGLSDFGLEWNACFADITWLSVARDKLIRAGSLFEINRGERRGWDEMFYPEAGHGIEPDYIRPVLKTPASVKGLIATADCEAFCCARTLVELKRLDHTGALAWINKFDGQVNETGEPLTEALKRTGKQWYEMSDSTLADLFASINYGDRLFVGRLKQRSFVNQRLTRFTLSESGIDIGLCHALLNSIASLWFLEALGFGRGLGALDLNSTKLKKSLYMFDPNQLDAKRTAGILGKFAPLLKRPVKPILEELQSSDRLAFEQTVLDSYGLASLLPQIAGSLKELYAIRMAAVQ